MPHRKFDRRTRSPSSESSPSPSQEEESLPRRRRQERAAGKKGLRYSPGNSPQESDSSSSSSWSATEPTEDGFSNKDEKGNEDDSGYEDEEINSRKHHTRRFFAPSFVVGTSASGSPSAGDFRGKNPANPSPVSSNTGLQSAYINIAPLPIFRGDSTECPVAHLSRFARVCRANNATSGEMMMRIFPVTLDGEAGLWYELNVEPRHDITWDEITSLFVKTFQRLEFFDQFRSELMMIRQAPGETVNAFYLRIQWLLKKWPEHGIPETMVKGIFIDGLKEDYQDWIIPQGPSSLEEALRLASTWEQAQIIKARRKIFSGNENRGKESSERTNEETGKHDRAIMVVKNSHKNVAGNGKPSTTRCEFCDGPHDEKGCEIKKEMRQLWRKMQGDGEEEREQGEAAGGGREKAEGSPVGSEGRGEEEKGGGPGLERKRSMCQCWKHQCWKRSERGSFVLDRTPSSATDKG
uniref:Retrotransposon gag domain-containing protein n=1 Tax=Nymphaea colorata TaxID=210225 RepID=A0A5K0Z8C3_9MAGN